MSLWDAYFTAASWDGAEWFEGDFSDGDLSPEDILMHQLCEFLKRDSRMQQVFGDGSVEGARIEVVDTRPTGQWADERMMPRLYLYSGVTDQEHRLTAADYTVCRIYIGMAFSLSSLPTVKSGRATTSSVLHWIKRAIESTHDTAVTKKWNHVDISASATKIIEDYVIQPYDTIRILDETGREFVQLQEMMIEARTLIDRDNGRIQTIVDAGG